MARVYSEFSNIIQYLPFGLKQDAGHSSGNLHFCTHYRYMHKMPELVMKHIPIGDIHSDNPYR